jgi:hypothetical protein
MIRIGFFGFPQQHATPSREIPAALSFIPNAIVIPTRASVERPRAISPTGDRCASVRIVLNVA